jgi:type III pantothenate kinase
MPTACPWFLQVLDTLNIDFILNLIIDIGNTRAKVAVFASSDLVHLEIFENFDVYDLHRILKDYGIQKCILSNSGMVSEGLLDELLSCTEFLHFGKDTLIPIKNGYDSKNTLGNDRLAGAVGTLFYFPKGNTLKIDMGTCITMDFVNGELEFVGGNISPGVHMRLKAMHHFTAKLPLVEVEVHEEIFGKSTTTAMQNGAVKGAFCEIDSFIERVREEFGIINVILTGGDAILFEKYTKNEIFVAPNLVLEGLNEILKYNANKN